MTRETYLASNLEDSYKNSISCRFLAYTNDSWKNPADLNKPCTIPAEVLQEKDVKRLARNITFL